MPQGSSAVRPINGLYLYLLLISKVPSSYVVKHAQVLCHSRFILVFLGRMLPVFTLVVPTVMFGLLRYLFCIMVRGTVNQIMHFSHRHEQEKQVRFVFCLFVCLVLQPIVVVFSQPGSGL